MITVIKKFFRKNGTEEVQEHTRNTDKKKQVLEPLFDQSVFNDLKANPHRLIQNIHGLTAKQLVELANNEEANGVNLYRINLSIRSFVIANINNRDLMNNNLEAVNYALKNINISDLGLVVTVKLKKYSRGELC